MNQRTARAHGTKLKNGMLRVTTAVDEALFIDLCDSAVAEGRSLSAHVEYLLKCAIYAAPTNSAQQSSAPSTDVPNSRAGGASSDALSVRFTS